MYKTPSGGRNRRECVVRHPQHLYFLLRFRTRSQVTMFMFLACDACSKCAGDNAHPDSLES